MGTVTAAINDIITSVNKIPIQIRPVNSYVLLDELETEFKTEFSIDEVVETKNVANIKKYLKKHGIELND